MMDKINKKFFHVNELKKGMMNCKDNEKKKKLIIELTHQIISLNMELALLYSELDKGVDFINDWEKMVDYYQMSKEEFLKSYSYLSEKDYEATDDRVVREGLRLEDVTNVGVNCKPIKKDHKNESYFN